jgi:hypothetical protein
MIINKQYIKNIEDADGWAGTTSAAIISDHNLWRVQGKPV